MHRRGRTSKARARTQRTRASSTGSSISTRTSGGGSNTSTTGACIRQKLDSVHEVQATPHQNTVSTLSEPKCEILFTDCLARFQEPATQSLQLRSRPYSSRRRTDLRSSEHVNYPAWNALSRGVVMSRRRTSNSTQSALQIRISRPGTLHRPRTRKILLNRQRANITLSLRLRHRAWHWKMSLQSEMT